MLQQEIQARKPFIPKVNVHKQQSGVNKGVICLRRTDVHMVFDIVMMIMLLSEFQYAFESGIAGGYDFEMACKFDNCCACMQDVI